MKSIKILDFRRKWQSACNTGKGSPYPLANHLDDEAKGSSGFWLDAGVESSKIGKSGEGYLIKMKN